MNLLAGSLAVFFTLHARFEFVVILFIVSLLADFLDGLVARLLNVTSPIGAQLDSLADMVSFGLLPGVLMYALFVPFTVGVIPKEGFLELTHQLHITDKKAILIGFIGFLIPLFSALRLAKFNVDETQSDEFKGLATPACALFVVGLWLGKVFNGFQYPAWLLIVITVLLCALLVSNIPMFSFKMNGWGWKSAGWHYVFISLAIVSLIVFKFAAISLIIVIYVLMNLIRYFVNKNKNVQSGN